MNLSFHCLWLVWFWLKKTNKPVNLLVDSCVWCVVSLMLISRFSFCIMCLGVGLFQFILFEVHRVLDMSFMFFTKFVKFWSIISSNIFSMPFSFSFHSSNHIVYVDAHHGVPQVSENFDFLKFFSVSQTGDNWNNLNYQMILFRYSQLSYLHICCLFLLPSKNCFGKHLVHSACYLLWFSTFELLSNFLNDCLLFTDIIYFINIHTLLSTFRYVFLKFFKYI